jgi:hypothetical protein
MSESEAVDCNDVPQTTKVLPLTVVQNLKGRQAKYIMMNVSLKHREQSQIIHDKGTYFMSC